MHASIGSRRPTVSDYIVASLLLAASASDCLQRLTCEACMQKQLVLRGPLAHARIFFKDLAHLLGLLRG